MSLTAGSTGNHVFDMWLGEQEARASRPYASEPEPKPSATCAYCHGTGMAGPDPSDTCDECDTLEQIRERQREMNIAALEMLAGDAMDSMWLRRQQERAAQINHDEMNGGDNGLECER